jgi:hypothetical protein
VGHPICRISCSCSLTSELCSTFNKVVVNLILGISFTATICLFPTQNVFIFPLRGWITGDVELILQMKLVLYLRNLLNFFSQSFCFITWVSVSYDLGYYL